MGNQGEAAALLTQIGCSVLCREPLSRHTTFQIGGPARIFCTPQNRAQLEQAIRVCKETGLRYYLLGKGSNVLFSDDGFDGVVLHVGEALGAVRTEKHCVIAEAGAPLTRVCSAAADAGLSGLAFAYGIPGCVGGAVYMNAGAYGGEMRDVLESVTFLNEEGQEQTLPADKLELGYRTSVFEKRAWCILEAVFRLCPGEKSEIRAKMDDFLHRRREKQPLELPSAGSTFKRPVGAYAGGLIDQCGLRGFQMGGAAISQKHCGFVVNLGGATCADVLALTDRVCGIVKERTGFVLEKEIRVVR